MNLLLVTILLPLAGAVLISLLYRQGQVTARWIALVCSGVTLILTAWLVATDHVTPFEHAWLPSSSIDIRFSVGLDGLGLWMFALSALLTVTGVLVSWEDIKDRAPAFYALLLLLETGLLGVFTARDIILFYIFFEFTLIPLFFLIGIWGHEERRYAAMKFFLFTLAGSMLTFLGLLAIVLWNFYAAEPGHRVLTFFIPELIKGLELHPVDPRVQLWIFLALFAGFAIKVPLFPLHTWLPLAHVQAPTAGSVDLAGILLKIGTYGFLRFSMPLLPEATVLCMPWILWLAVAGIIYGALVALAQTDMKRLIAYSSVSHLGFCMLGMFALNDLGVKGGVLQMINHGISTGGLFALVGMIYERYHTREIGQLSGLARRTPWLAAFMLIFTLASIGLPGTNGFVGEFMILMGMFQRGWASAPDVWALQWKVISVVAVLGVVLGAWYMLWLIERVFFGPLRETEHKPGDPPVQDLKPREILALSPLVVFIFWIGLQPQYFLERMNPELDNVATIVSDAFDKKYGLPEVKAAAIKPVPATGTPTDVGKGQVPSAKVGWLGASSARPQAPLREEALPVEGGVARVD